LSSFQSLPLPPDTNPYLTKPILISSLASAEEDFYSLIEFGSNVMVYVLFISGSLAYRGRCLFTAGIKDQN